MAWFIKGEAGKTLDATLREIHTLNIDSCSLKFSSLAEDELSWSAATEDATGAGTIVPDIGQVVELFKDSDRKFRGHVVAPKVGSKRITVKVVGPWWWMTRIPMTSDQVDGVGVTAERVNYVFNSGAHKTKIDTLLARAVTNGVPMIAGTVATMYDTPKMSIAGMNCGQALAELMAWVPDAVAWFDYSGATGTNPTLNIGRRGTFSATSYTIGVDAVIDHEITPRLDLEVSQVSLDYVTRNGVTGQPAWANQIAGSAVTGKKQIVTVSGPEITDFLPTETIERIPIYFSTTTPARAIEMSSPSLQKLVALYSTAAVRSAALTDPYTGGNKAKVLTGREQYEEASTGTYSTTGCSLPGGKTAILLGLDGQSDAPDWLLSEYGLTRWYVNDFHIMDGHGTTSIPAFDGVRRGAINNAFPADVQMFSSNNNGTGNGTPIYTWFIRHQRGDDLPIYLIDTASLPAEADSGTLRSSTSASQVQLRTGASAVNDFYTGKTVFWTKDGVRYGAVISSYNGSTKIAQLAGGAVVTAKAPANGQAYVVAAEFVSSWSYDFLIPPAGLADGLRLAQNWVPWEGPIKLISDDVSGNNLLNGKYNLLGTLTPCATMATLARNITHDIFSGRTTIDLGAPARADFGSLTSRIRRQPRDNIVTL